MSAKIKANNAANINQTEEVEQPVTKIRSDQDKVNVAKEEQSLSVSVTRPNSTDNNKISPRVNPKQKAKAQTKVVMKENKPMKMVESKAGVKRKLNEVSDVISEGRKQVKRWKRNGATVF